MKSNSESSKGSFQRGRSFYQRERSFKNQESYGARNQSFTFRGSRGNNHDGYSNWMNNNVNAQCYNYKEYGHYASNYSQNKHEDKKVNFI